jgi:hypothetical protein
MEVKSSILTLAPGVYILRHPKGGLAPLSVSRAPAGGGAAEGTIQQISSERSGGSILRDGSDCIVMQVCGAPVTLLVAAFLAHADDTVPALRVDQVGLDPAPAAGGGAPIVIGGRGISIIGHIERTGDVVAGQGQLLGEADSGLRLEGFQVMWPDRPEGVDLAYRIAVEGGESTPIVKTGKFCGTKGEARRITELSFVLVGPAVADWRLEGTACFSGGYALPVQSGQALSGPSGLEHLTALGLNVVAARAGDPADNPWQESARTKVFRAEPAAPAAKPAAAPKNKPSRAADKGVAHNGPARRAPRTPT